VLRPLGAFAIVGTLLAALGHFMTYGPKRPEGTAGEGV
jgi:Formate dehydrogenase N, transmembrane